MVGDLPRISPGALALVTLRMLRTGIALALSSVVFLAGALRAAADQPAGRIVIPESAQGKLAEIRRFAGCLAEPTDDVGVEISFKGRSSIEIKGHERGGAGSGTVRDLAVFDPAAGRIVAYVCFANSSTRKSGEAIVSLAEVSSRADRLARVILPGANLELESIDRRRSGETESIYYEAGYMSASGEFPFLETPVRLFLNATTGELFRLDIDAEWIDPANPARVLISRKAAERVATVVLRGRNLAPVFGSGASIGKVAAAEMFTVHPNGWLGFFAEYAEARARVAWVVPFRVDGGDTSGLHHLFVDAATGRIIGGLPGRSAGQLPH